MREKRLNRPFSSQLRSRFRDRYAQRQQQTLLQGRHLSKVLNQLPATIAYWDRHLKNSFANNAYRIWLGVNPDDIFRKHIRFVLGEALYRKNLPHIQAALRGEMQVFERAIPSPDSSHVRYGQVSYIPDIHPDGVRGFYVFVFDISPQKISQLALVASEERYRAVVEDQTELISRLHPNGGFLFVNQAYCRFFGKSLTELIQGTWQPVAHPDDVPLITAELKKLSPHYPVVIIENRVYSANGQEHWMQFANHGFFDSSGHLVEIQSVGRDITARKQAEAALQEAHDTLENKVIERTEQLRRLAIEATLAEERERRAIARDLHDDLGQILHIMKIRLELLKKSVAPVQKDNLTELELFTHRASALVRSFTAQLSPPVLENLGLTAALRWLEKEVLEIYGLAVTTDIEEPNCTLSHTQAVILFRIARELLINITKHAEVDDAELSLRFDGEQVLLRVSDHGRGIANQEQALSGVSGFGLNSVRERITFLGGSMSLLSGPQQGLTVTVKLPVEQKGEKHDH